MPNPATSCSALPFPKSPRVIAVNAWTRSEGLLADRASVAIRRVASVVVWLTTEA
jgi:hypothetical protein